VTNPYRDPIEKFTTEVQVFGMRQLPGQPEQTEAFFHVRRRQDGAMEAAMGLPAYKGDKGTPGNPPVVYLVADESEIPSAGGLSAADAGKGWRVEGSQDVRFWTGTTFVLHTNWLGAEGDQGPAGPANVLSPGTITMLAEGEEPTIDITGTSPSQILSLGIPEKAGPEGPVGPAAAIEASTDYEDDGVDAVEGQVLAKRDDGDWGPVTPVTRIEEYVVAASSFPNVTKTSAQTSHQIVAVSIPAKAFDYRLDVSGAVDVLTAAAHRVEVEIRIGHPTSGALVGIGRALEAAVWREARIRSYAPDAFSPGSTTGVIAAGSAITVYCTAVLKSGFTSDWQLRNDFANLRLKLIGAA
jgi:hypothetical protein